MLVQCWSNLSLHRNYSFSWALTEWSNLGPFINCTLCAFTDHGHSFSTSLKMFGNLLRPETSFSLVLLNKYKTNISMQMHVARSRACTHTNARTHAHTALQPPIRNRLPKNRCCSKANHLYRDCIHMWLCVSVFYMHSSVVCLNAFSGFFIISYGLVVRTRKQLRVGRTQWDTVEFTVFCWLQFHTHRMYLK